MSRFPMLGGMHELAFAISLQSSAGRRTSMSGDQVRVKLVRTNPEHGFIDFARVDHVPVGPQRR